MAHTPEPWCFRPETTGFRDRGGHYHPGKPSAVLDGGGNVIVETDTDDDARRIAACVNACAGLPTEVLEANALDATVGRLVIAQADLLAACKEVLAWADHSRAFCEREDLEVLARVKDAVAKAEGG